MQTNMNFPTYVFATVNSGRATKVVEELKRNSQIDIIAPVTGRYDLVLRLKPNTPQNIYQTVKEIREISDVRTTDTHTGFDGMQPTKKLESQMALGVSVLTCEHNTSENVVKQLSNIPGFIEATTVLGKRIRVHESAEPRQSAVPQGLFSEHLGGPARWFVMRSDIACPSTECPLPAGL